MHFSGVNLQKLKHTEAELNSFIRYEKVMWRQLFQIDWLRDGDKNTEFFHQRAKERMRKNIIWALNKEDDTWTESQEELYQEVSSFFSQLFTNLNPMRIAEILT